MAAQYCKDPKQGLLLTDIERILKEFYKDAEEIGTTDAVINVIEKAYLAGIEYAKANIQQED